MFTSSGRLHVHFAIPFYAGDQLIRSLRSRPEKASPGGVAIPDPDLYRNVLSRKASGEDLGRLLPAEQVRLARHLDDGAQTLVLSMDALGVHPTRMFDRGRVHLGLEYRIDTLQVLFPNRELSLFFSAADPGAIMAAMLNSNAAPHLDPETAAGIRPLWSDLMARLEARHPDLPVTIWAMEDTPCTWPVVLRETLGLPPEATVDGGLHMAASLLDQPGRRALRSLIRRDAPPTERALVGLLANFLSEWVSPERLCFEVDHPGWTPRVLENFEEIYLEDLDACLDHEQVRLITTETVTECVMGAEQEISRPARRGA